MQIVKTISQAREIITKLKLAQNKIALIPTMGSLHDGHLSLIELAKKQADITITSIFVNNKQFDDQDDFINYPKNIEEDITKLQTKKVDILFCPNQEEIYTKENLINFNINKLGQNLCGKYRQNHFQGVLLIVNKLFNIIKPDIAVFGQKDFQQLQIITQMVQDLNIDTKIIAAPILREKSGLAMSSRNKRLDKNKLEQANLIFQNIKDLRNAITQSNEQNLSEILEKFRQKFIQEFDQLEYLEICSENNLQKIEKFDPAIKSRIFVAVYLGNIRLIDNLPLT
jgi:pantoate--beta-alanine ligase